MPVEETYRRVQLLSIFVVVSMMVLGFSVLGIALYEDHQRGVQAEQACVELEKVRTYARQAAGRARDSLPTVAYYRQHPDELAKALADIDRQLRSFSPPLDCQSFS